MSLNNDNNFPVPIIFSDNAHTIMEVYTTNLTINGMNVTDTISLYTKGMYLVFESGVIDKLNITRVNWIDFDEEELNNAYSKENPSNNDYLMTFLN